jgi:signal transduction histidine kinase
MTSVTDSLERVRAGGLDQRTMRRLLRAVRDLSACRDVADVVEVVRVAARHLVDADGATFVFRDGGHCFYVDEDAIEPLWRGQRFPLDTCVSGWAMEHEEQAVIPDIYQDPRVPHEAYRPTFVKSMVMTPVRCGRGVAAIGTYWAEPRRATPEEQEVLQALADSTAVALENARTLEGLEATVAERTAELRASNRDLAGFAHLVAHDLKAPLTTILGRVELIGMDPATRDHPGGESLAAIDRQARRMAQLIDGVLSYSTAATSELQVEHLDLGALVGDVLQDLSGVVEHRAADVVVADPLPSAVGSRTLLERAVQNLLGNAVAYSDPTHPRLRVEGAVEGGHTVLQISDNGPGVPEAERESVFEMFTRGSTSAGSAGSGIGLAFSRRVVERHGGTLTVDDAPGGGARFTLRLPLPASQH